MIRLDQGFRTEYNEAEAQAANQLSRSFLAWFAENLVAGIPPEHPDTQTLAQRYRKEYIDEYLFPCTPPQIYALGLSIAVDPNKRKVCEDYQEGLADYLSQALIAYYEAWKRDLTQQDCLQSR